MGEKFDVKISCPRTGNKLPNTQDVVNSHRFITLTLITGYNFGHSVYKWRNFYVHGINKNNRWITFFNAPSLLRLIGLGRLGFPKFLKHNPLLSISICF